MESGVSLITEIAPARCRNPAASSEKREDQYQYITLSSQEKNKLQRERLLQHKFASVMDFHKMKWKERNRLSSLGPYSIVIHSGETCEGVVCQNLDYGEAGY